MTRPSSALRRPTPFEIQAAAGRTVEDVIAPNLRVLFCGINPGLYTAAIGHHFGRPGNRFWPVLHAAGITPRLFSPYEERELLKFGYGITNIVARATATAAELTKEELIVGSKTLQDKVLFYKPGILAVLGLSAYRAAFRLPKAKIGPQDHFLGDTQVWALPNPSGLNAHYQLPQLADLFSQLRKTAASDEFIPGKADSI